MSSKKEKSSSKHTTPIKSKLKDQVVVKDVKYVQVNVTAVSNSVNTGTVSALLSERAQCKANKNYERADAIARSLQAMNVSLINGAHTAPSVVASVVANMMFCVSCGIECGLMYI